MSSELLIGALTISIALATIVIEHGARKRASARVSQGNERDRARAARITGLANRRKQEDGELERLRYEHNLQVQATERLTAWALRCSQILSKADHFLMKPEKFRQGLTWELAAELSSLIDEGRWLFRNHRPDDFGGGKAPLNRGFRDNRLDPLVIMYKKLLGAKAFDPCRERKDFAFKIQQLSLPLAAQTIEKDKSHVTS